MAFFHGSVSTSTNKGEGSEPHLPDPARLTGGTCRSVNGVYNTSLGFGLFTEQIRGLHINSDGFRLAPWTFSRNRGKMAITSPLS